LTITCRSFGLPPSHRVRLQFGNPQHAIVRQIGEIEIKANMRDHSDVYPSDSLLLPVRMVSSATSAQAAGSSPMTVSTVVIVRYSSAPMIGRPLGRQPIFWTADTTA
jgi:hypothetical protein